MIKDSTFNIIKVYIFLTENVQNKEYCKQSMVARACDATAGERGGSSLNLKPAWATQQDPALKHLERGAGEMFEASVHEMPLEPRIEEAEAGRTGRFGADRDVLLQREAMAFTPPCRALAL